MRSDKALTLFNQIVGVKVLDDLDSFIRTNMLEELPAEEKYQELKDNFQNLMEAKTNIDKVKEQIAQLEPINALTEELKEIDIRIVEMEQEKRWQPIGLLRERWICATRSWCAARAT